MVHSGALCLDLCCEVPPLAADRLGLDKSETSGTEQSFLCGCNKCLPSTALHVGLMSAASHLQISSDHWFCVFVPKPKSACLPFQDSSGFNNCRREDIGNHRDYSQIPK